MKSIQCAICGNKQKTEILYKENLQRKKINWKTFSARRTPDKIHYRFVKCLNCGLIFSNPIYSEEKISNLYRESTFDYSLEASFLKKTYGYYMKKMFPRLSKNSTLLDIGCGDGFFLEKTVELGYKFSYGIEPGSASVKKAKSAIRKKIKVGFFTKNSYKKEKFDVICCFHTLDHIVDPNKFLQAVYYALKKRGKVFFVLHDTNGLSVKLFGEKSPIFDVEHIFLFNKKNLSEIFVNNGFVKTKTFSIKNTYPLIYWFRMIPLPPVYKNFLLYILMKSGLSNFPLSIPAGNMGIVAEK